MGEDLDQPAVQAARAAGAAAQRVGVTVRELEQLNEMRTAIDLFCRVWNADSPDQLINISIMRAMAHAGNYIVGAYRDGAMIGAVAAFLGPQHLHSHLAGVEPGGQGAGVGYVLKLHQRAWSLARGLPEVRWTFDPLIRRNAYFNLQKLGACATGYLVDFYGPLEDGINVGDATDRLYVRWVLASPAAVEAAGGRPLEVPKSAASRLVEVPPDIEALRASDPRSAADWRYAVREALQRPMGEGWRIAGITRDGFYVLEPPPPCAGSTHPAGETTKEEA
ncbi:MAG: GNAT family N-acetyltransferase [Micromonosporaceae bacterium]|nr:GNAT family N-acetyltransferase [Micromonosporaceae bacterium]